MFLPMEIIFLTTIAMTVINKFINSFMTIIFYLFCKKKISNLNILSFILFFNFKQIFEKKHEIVYLTRPFLRISVYDFGNV